MFLVKIICLFELELEANLRVEIKGDDSGLFYLKK
jgi:hypothetical protein